MRLIIVLLLGVAAFYIIDLIYKKKWFKNLNAHVDFEKDTMREGEENVMNEYIVNDKLLPLPVIEVKFSISRSLLFPNEVTSSVTDNYYRCEYFTCRSFQRITRKYKFKAARRGEFHVNSLDVVCKDLLIDKSMFGTYNEKSYVTVLPGRIPMQNVPKDILKLTGTVVSRFKLLDDPFEFKSIREYQPYDPMNHINWKVSAKIDEMHVNTFNSTDRKKVVVLLNLESNTVRYSEPIGEASIKIAAFLADYFMSKELPVAFATNGKDLITNAISVFESGNGDGHLRTIETALARVDLKKNKSSFTDLMDLMIDVSSNDEYVIVSNYRKNDLLDKYYELQKSGVNVNLIVPEFDHIQIDPVEQTAKEVKWVIQNEY